MSATVKATCPGCRAPLAIPAGLLGQPVRCTKCRAVVRAKSKAPAAPPPADPPRLVATPDPFAGPAAPPPAPPVPVVYYAPPAVPGPTPGPLDLSPDMDFDPSDATRAHAGRYRKSGRGGFLVRAVVVLAVAGGLVAAGVYGAKHLPGLIAGARPEGKSEPEVKPPAPVPAAAAAYPRRLLFVHASHYLFLNPLTGAPAPGNSKPLDRTRAQAQRLALEWRIPDDQLYIVSDTDPKATDRRPPTKPVLAAAFEQFFATCRPQDRAVVYFGGHVLLRKVDDGETAYLVPLEGDPDDPETLLPLADVYAKLAACKAGQKVVIWEVCRFNPDRGRQRPGSEPMSEALAAALSAAPAGVQVVTTCRPGENALEFTSLSADGPTRKPVAGSNFLEAVDRVVKGKSPPKAGGPNDPIPVADWADALGRRVAEVAAAAEGGPKQTVAAAGDPPSELPPADPNAPPAGRLTLAPPPAGSVAAAADVVKEFALPGIKADDEDAGLAAFPYPPDALAAYTDDATRAAVTDPANREKYLLRATVLEAFDTMRELWGKDGRPQLRESFVGATTDAVKKEVTAEQDFPAMAIELLEKKVLLPLEAVEDRRAAEPKRWQAHYDYAVAQAKARLAFLQEYNLALGNIKTEVLPARNPKLGHDGYRLVAAAGMKAKDAKRLAEEAKELFAKMATDYKGTPWGVQARRDRDLNLGLAWQPFNSKAAAEKDD
ncbi:MAG: zinc-ribbon domain-containing protein [Gemmataceae bacterium]|nr:zinc-ribbon domain-containing protein [Gemmataceae bacterium]